MKQGRGTLGFHLAAGMLLLGSQSLQASEAFCLDSQLAKRSGSASCWISLSSQKGVRVCVARSDWLKLLDSKQGPWGCATWTGRWRLFASRRNTLGEVVVAPMSLSFEAVRAPARALGPAREVIRWKVERLREKISTWLEPLDPHGLYRSLMLAQSPDREVAALWRLLGFVHLLSASGIHLYVLGRVLRRVILGVTRVFGIGSGTSEGLSWIGSSAACAVVWTLSGARPGMLRPWAIVGLRSSAQYLGIKWAAWAPLSLSLGFDLILAIFRGWRGFHEPLTGGRFHYALAVGGGLLSVEVLRKARRSDRGFWREHLALAVGSWCFVVPLELYEKGGTALGTPFLSALSLPLISALIYPGLLLGSLSLFLGQSPSEWRCLSGILEAFGSGLQWLTQGLLKVETLWVLSPVAWCAGSVLAALTLRRKIPWQMWGIAIIAKTLVVSFAGFGESGAVEVHAGLDAQAIPAASQVEQLDIGQGDAALIQSEKWGGVGLIDAGSRLALNPSEWFTLFAQRKIRHLDFIVLSHLDEDHSGGALRLAALIPVRCVQTSRLQWESPRGIQLAAALQARGVRVADHEAGCFPYRVYGPKEIAPSAEKNGAMSAFWVPLERGGGYFGMGDADETDERGFLGRALDDIQHPLILKISHHGSRTSTSAFLLQKLAPERAWISCGIGNHFGHPTSRVLHLLEESHIPVERTDLQGVLTSATL